jgi:PAS domain S-box-containing protein
LSKEQDRALQRARGITLIYVIVSTCWILFSDELLQRLISNPEERTRLSIVKGWGFVVVTGGFLYSLLRQWLRQLAEETEKLRQAEAGRQEAGEKLRQSEERLRLVMEASADGLWDWNLKSGIVYLSPRYSEITGLPAGEIAADLESLRPLVHPEDWPSVLKTVNDHLAGKSPRNVVEYRRVIKDGPEKWIWGRGKVVERAPDGRPLRMVGTISDISDRKRVETNLRESEEKFSKVFHSSPVGMTLSTKAEGRYLDVNDTFLELLQRSREEVIGHTAMELRVWVSSEQRDTFLSELKAGDRTHHIEVRWHTKSGQIREVVMSGEEVVIGGIDCLLGTVLDITERKETARRLLQLNRIYALLSDINQNIVREKDPNAMLVAACRIAVEKGKFRMAWTGLWNAATQRLEPVASAGAVDGYLDLVKIDLGGKSRGNGPGASCLRSGKHVICNDIEDDPQYPPWRDEALRRGYHSVAAFPLKVEGQTAGVFNLYADTPRFFNEEEVQLLDELAMNISFALEVSSREKERQRIEQELQASEERYKLIFDSAPDAVLLLAADGGDTGRILAANDIAARMHGYLPGELVGKRIEDLDTPQTAAQAPERFRRISRGEGLTFEVEHRRKDGTIFPVEVTVKQIIVDGRACFLAFDRDISERRLVQEVTVRLAMAVAQAAETIVITDTQGTVLYANPAFEKTSGYTIAEAVGQNPRLLKSGKHSNEFYRQMWETLGRGETWHGHFINRRKDGTLYEEEATISPVRDAAGKMISYVAVKRDVTREVQLERQFLQAQKMQSVGQLAGGVAHDFNNMLAAMMMHLSLLQCSKELTAGTQETIEELIGEAKRAANLTRQLLMFSRRSVMEVKLLDLNELVTNLLRMLGRLIGEHIIVRFDRREGLPTLEGDPGMIEQMIMNLAVNARDAMPKGGGLAIGIEAVQVDAEGVREKLDVQPGQFLCLSMADNGCGMDEATRLRLFEPFFTTKEPGKGTGLGLATVHGIVAQHKGWVEVESEVGKGTTFRVFLPASAKTITTAPKAGKMAAMRGHETILVVEDEVELRRLLTRSLRLLGYAVFEAENGQAAMNLWQKQGGKFDLLLSDMVMPEGLTGLDLAEKFKKERPNLKVIISSGYSVETAGHSRLAAHGVLYLQKPYSVESLSKTIRDCLDGKTEV